jgi:hypothetical protein
MISERLQKALKRVYELPEEEQNAFAEVLEQLLRAYRTEDQRPPALRPELEALMKQVMSEHSTLLEYLKDK